MQNVYELYRAGLLTTITIKDVPSVDMVQMTIARNLKEETSGKDMINSTLEMYFTPREFTELFQQICNDMKVRFDVQNSSQSNT